MITQNDYKIITAIIDRTDKSKGVEKINGTTKQEVINKTGLSNSKVTQTLYKFIANGMLEYGLMKGNAKTYCLSELGFNEILKLKGEDIND